MPLVKGVLLTPSMMNIILQKSVHLAHQAARQWQGPPLSTAVLVMLGCCTTQLAVGSFSRTAFGSQVLTIFMKQLIWKASQLACSAFVFLSHPGNVDVQLKRLCWMACA